MQGQTGKRLDVSGTGATPRATLDWLVRPPYPIAWILAALLLGAAGALLLSRPRESARTVVLAPAPTPAGGPVVPSVVVPPAGERMAQVPEEGEKAPTPQVTIRPAPPRKPDPARASTAPPQSAPSLGIPAVPGAPTLPGEPGLRFPESFPREAAPVPEALPENTTPVEPPRAIEPPPVPEPRPRVERPRRPAPEPVRSTGTLSLYFDADSTTFDRDDRRLPLRVEVYVDGVKQLETDDPEKRRFRLGRLPEGRHEIEIVPHVGDAPAEPRREIVDIRPDGTSSFKAVLRRSKGVSRISKFELRD